MVARLPSLSDAGYVPALLDIAQENSIKLVVPTIDPELPIFATAFDDFEAIGARVAVSTLSLVETVADKLKAFAFLAKENIATPETWLPERLPAVLPDRLFVKPRFGSASAFCFPASRAELTHFLAVVPNPIVQPELSGQEITVDALFDFSSVLIHFVPRVRRKTMGGESTEGETLSNDELASWITTVLRALGSAGARGPLTLQAFLTKNGPVVTDVNPRFGGGVPLTFAAGGNYADWLLRMAANENVPVRLGDYEAGLLMTRALTEEFTTEPYW